MAKRRKRKWSVGPSKLILPEQMASIRAYLELRRDRGVDGRRQWLIGWLLAATGMRAFELCGLRLRDLPVVHGADAVEVRGKGGRDRSIPLNPDLSEAIRVYVHMVRPGTLPATVRPTSRTGMLFYSQRKTIYKPKSIYRMVRRWGERLGLEKRITPHMFRHSYATYAIGQADLEHVRYLLGHSNIAITQIYLHASRYMLSARGKDFDPFGR